jgi:uncharacterized protein
VPENVSFLSRELRLAGHLYRPDSAGGEPQAAVVVSHPFGGVKEQTAGLYAKELAKKGFIALVFDCSYQGDSEGEPHFLEDPFHRAEDIRSAVSFLQSLPEVDAERIGALGICASGGYVPYTASTELRIKAVATVSAMDVGSTIRDGFDGRKTDQSDDNLQAVLALAAADRAGQAHGAAPTLIDFMPTSLEEIPEGLEDVLGEGVEYYHTPRGQHPNSTMKLVAGSYTLMAEFQAYPLIDLISPRPLLMIVGSNANSIGFSQGAIAKAGEPKELFVIDGASHVDLYDQPQYVDQVVDKLGAFFAENLS